MPSEEVVQGDLIALWGEGAVPTEHEAVNKSGGGGGAGPGVSGTS